MPVRLCPTCGRPTIRARSSPRDSQHYYRCTNCRHLWCTPKHDPDAAAITLMTGRMPATDAEAGGGDDGQLSPPQPPPHCPRCSNGLKHLPKTSHFELEHWYRCVGCGRVFTVAKDQPFTKPVLLSLED